MKCSDARHLIHLSVGDDNLPDEEQTLGEHLHTCSDCRAYNAGMVDAMQLLHNLRNSTIVTSDRSVWRSVIGRIEDRRRFARTLRRPQREFHGGVVALCALSLVLAFVTIVQKLPVNDSTFASVPVESMNVSAPVIPASRVQPQVVRGTFRLNSDGSYRLLFEPSANRNAVSPVTRETIQTSSDQVHF